MDRVLVKSPYVEFEVERVTVVLVLRLPAARRMGVLIKKHKPRNAAAAAAAAAAKEQAAAREKITKLTKGRGGQHKKAGWELRCCSDRPYLRP